MLGGINGTGRLLANDLLGLLSLLVGKICSALDLLVNELLVVLVDERSKEDDGSANKCQAPEWHDLDKIVANECSNKHLVLSERQSK